MRLALAFCLCLALGVPSVLADPSARQEEKEWHFDLSAATAVYPEVEPNNTCDTAQPWACGDVIDPASITAADYDYYVFTATAGWLVTIGTDRATGCTTDMDTYIELYAADCSTRLAYDDDSGPVFYSLISNFAIPSDGRYYLRVRGYSTTTTGCYKAFITCTIPEPPPVNDTCAGALPLDRCSSGSLAGDTFYAHDDYNPGIPGPSCTGYTAAGKDVAYVMNLQVGDVVALTYTQPSADASFYIVTDCANPSASCVIGADATVTGQPETINWTCTVAGTYYVILDSYTSAYGGPWTLTWSITCPVPTGACCFHPGGDCRILTQDACLAAGGMYVGDGTDCYPGLCPPTAAEPSTWGQIKHVYR